MDDKYLVQELPDWLKEMIEKKLLNRMSRPEAEKLMYGTLSDLNSIFSKNGNADKPDVPIRNWRDYNIKIYGDELFKNYLKASNIKYQELEKNGIFAHFKCLVNFNEFFGINTFIGIHKLSESCNIL